jgi:hypothetical protein
VSIKEIWDHISGFLIILNTKSSKLFAISVACLLSSAVLILIHVYIKSVIDLDFYLVVLVTITIITGVIGSFNLYSENNIQTVKLVPYGDECFVHKATQPDGSITTQIICDVYVFNLTDKTIWLPQIKLSKPKTNVQYLSKIFTVREQAGRFYGGYEIPPYGKTDGRGHIIIDEDLSSKIKKGGIVLKVADQYNHWHELKFPNVKFS